MTELSFAGSKKRIRQASNVGPDFKHQSNALNIGSRHSYDKVGISFHLVRLRESGLA